MPRYYLQWRLHSFPPISPEQKLQADLCSLTCAKAILGTCLWTVERAWHFLHLNVSVPLFFSGTALESMRIISLVPTVPCFPIPAWSWAAELHRQGLAPSLLSCWGYSVTFPTNTAALWDLWLIFVPIHEGNNPTSCYSCVVRGKVEVLSPTSPF